jgi:formylmethanofuran--tetrahydromethanopterin N-formyltransferase
MSGDFLVESEFGYKDAVAGGNFFIMADSKMSGLVAAEVAVDAISSVKGTITPFPGGMVASGSKVGCNSYDFLNASTNEKMCVSLKETVVETNIREDVHGVFEIVIDGVDEEAVKNAMREGIKAACTVNGVLEIDAGNFGGSLGAYKIQLRDLF